MKSYSKESVAKGIASKMSKKEGKKYIVFFSKGWDGKPDEYFVGLEQVGEVVQAPVVKKAKRVKQDSAEKVLNQMGLEVVAQVSVKYELLKEDDAYLYVVDANGFKFSFGKARVDFAFSENVDEVVLTMSAGYYAFHAESANRKAAKAMAQYGG